MLELEEISEMVELEGIPDSLVQPLTGHQFSQLSHIIVSTGLCCFCFHSLKALDSRQLNYTKMATRGEEGWRTPRQSLQGAERSRAVTQLRAKPNSLETAGNRGEAIKSYHSNPEGQEEVQLPVASLPERGGQPLLCSQQHLGPRPGWQKLPDRPEGRKLRKWRSGKAVHPVAKGNRRRRTVFSQSRGSPEGFLKGRPRPSHFMSVNPHGDGEHARNRHWLNIPKEWKPQRTESSGSTSRGSFLLSWGIFLGCWLY